MYEDEKMYEDQRNHFGMYHGQSMYRIINENDLWDLEYPILRELTYAIRRIIYYDRDSITREYFRRNPFIFYIEIFELWKFSEEYSLRLLEAVEELIEFKARLKAGWPWM